MARPWQTLACVDTAEGPLELRRRGDAEFLIVVAGRVLMTSAARRSEEALGRLGGAACAHLPAPAVLVGGLGMAFTLRAVLGALPTQARVDVAELSAAVVDWCRGPMAALTDGAVGDARVTVHVADVADVISAARPGAWNAIVLDFYEGPYGGQARHPVYGKAALGRAHRALGPGGVLAVWAEDADTEFPIRMESAGFQTRTERSGGAGGRRHIIYVGRRA